MSELDLDELHQAVNALMDEAGKKDKKTPAPAVKRTPKEPVAVAASAGNDNIVPVRVHRPLPTLGTHRGGRGQAMDIVGPKLTPKMAPPSSQPKRLGVMLHPTSPIMRDEPSATAVSGAPAQSVEPPMAQPKVSPEHAEVSDDLLASLNMQHDQAASVKPLAPAPEKQQLAREWPDPLDSQVSTPAPSAPVAPPPVEQPAAVPEQAPTMWAEPEPTAPSPEPNPTPFLAAKVEKRPLGAYAGPASEPEVPAEPVAPFVPSAAPVTDESLKAEAPTNAPAAAQPAELSPEVVAVESAEPQFYPPPTQANTVHGEADLDSARQMAIPQQYPAPQKETSKDTRPVFDTKEYHPPIQPVDAKHPNAYVPKQHHGGSGLITTLAVLLVLLLGIIGVAVYLVVSGTIDPAQLFQA